MATHSCIESAIFDVHCRLKLSLLLYYEAPSQIRVMHALVWFSQTKDIAQSVGDPMQEQSCAMPAMYARLAASCAWGDHVPTSLGGAAPPLLAEADSAPYLCLPASKLPLAKNHHSPHQPNGRCCSNAGSPYSAASKQCSLTCKLCVMETSHDCTPGPVESSMGMIHMHHT